MCINLFMGQLLKDFQIITDDFTAPVHVESASAVELGISRIQNSHHFHFCYTCIEVQDCTEPLYVAFIKSLPPLQSL